LLAIRKNASPRNKNCSVCGRLFIIQSFVSDYSYKLNKNYKRLYQCSYTCYIKEKELKLNEGKDIN